MAYNRYIGNTGRVIRVQEPGERESISPPPVPAYARPEAVRARRPAPPAQKTPSGAGLVGELFSRLSPDGLDTEDILLLMIFYLLYRESGDEEFLIMMGAMFLL